MPTEPAWTPSERYPDAAVQILNPRLLKYRLPLAGVERRATGARWIRSALGQNPTGCRGLAFG